jgi:biopolymer transport protein ExbD
MRKPVAKLNYFEYRKARIEIIPMIDVMLFLLVFFIIVTLQMIPDAGVSMQLPVSSQTDALPHPKFIVNVLPDGTLKVKEQVVTDDQLTAMFAGDGNPGQTEVTIAADKAVQFQKFMNVIDDAKKANVTDIGIAAQPDGSAE